MAGNIAKRKIFPSILGVCVRAVKGGGKRGLPGHWSDQFVDCA